jgi:hypothetical protein
MAESKSTAYQRNFAVGLSTVFISIVFLEKTVIKKSSVKIKEMTQPKNVNKYPSPSGRTSRAGIYNALITAQRVITLRQIFLLIDIPVFTV